MKQAGTLRPNIIGHFIEEIFEWDIEDPAEIEKPT
jgi:hypothetical protein